MPKNYTPVIFKGQNAKLINSGGVEFKDETLILTNAGNPEGVVTAPVGSLCLDKTNGNTYKKNTGIGNTGWLQLIDSTEDLWDRNSTYNFVEPSNSGDSVLITDTTFNFAMPSDLFIRKAGSTDASIQLGNENVGYLRIATDESNLRSIIEYDQGDSTSLSFLEEGADVFTLGPSGIASFYPDKHVYFDGTTGDAEIYFDGSVDYAFKIRSNAYKMSLYGDTGGEFKVGGKLELYGRTADGVTNAVEIVGENVAVGDIGSIYIKGGDSGSGSGADIILTPGTGTTTNGEIKIPDDTFLRIGTADNYFVQDSGTGRFSLRFDSTNSFAVESASGVEEFLFESTGAAFSQPLQMSGQPVSFTEMAADPTNVSNTGFVYTKDVTGITELFYEDDAGSVTQLTNNGTPMTNFWQRVGTDLSPVNAGDTLTISELTGGDAIISLDASITANGGMPRFIFKDDGVSAAELYINSSISATTLEVGGGLFSINTTGGATLATDTSLSFDSATGDYYIGYISNNFEMVAAGGNDLRIRSSGAFSMFTEADSLTDMSIYTGSGTSTNNSGNLVIQTGSTVDGNAGYLHLIPGEASGTGQSGAVTARKSFFVDRDGSLSERFLQVTTETGTVAAGDMDAVLNGGYFEIDSSIAAPTITYTDLISIHNKGVRMPTTSTSSVTYNATAANYTILCDASSNAITVNLPASASNSGLILNIKKTDSTANTVTIDGNASETIDGATTLSTSTQYEGFTIQCDGSNWHIIGRI